jgi:iron(III) transport system permease protein
LGRTLSRFGLLAVLGFLTGYPLAMLLYGSFHSTPPGTPGDFNLRGYGALLTVQTGSVLLNTAAIAFLKTVLTVVVAVPLAWIIARTDTPMRRTLEVLITLPFFLPGILTAMAWGMLGNPQVGLLNQAWEAMVGGTSPLIDVYSYGGVIWHMLQYSVPFAFIFFVDAFRVIDPSLEEASRMCGATPARTFGSITAVLMLPILSSVALSSFIHGIESFESPLFFGSPARIEVVTTRIYDAINTDARPDYQYATALGFAVVLLMCLLVLCQRWLIGKRSFQTVTGKGFAPRLTPLGRWKWVSLAGCLIFFFVTVVLPIGQLALGSMFDFMGFYSWDALTLEHYREVLADDELIRAAGRTLFLGVVGAVATMALGTCVAYVSVRTKWKGRLALDILAWLPWMMPGIILGIGFLWGMAFLPAGIPLYGTIWALLIAYLSLGSPLAVQIMSGALRQLSYDIEESSRVSGATFFQTLTRILVALAWPAFMSGMVLTFFGIIRELSASVLLYSRNSEVLSVALLKMWNNGQAEKVSVIGLIVMLMVIVIRLVQFAVFDRRVRAL